MTGYGRALLTTKSGLLEIEIHSVNRKALDIAIQIPRELLYLDVDMRYFVSESIERGQVTVRVTQRINGGIPSVAEMKRVKEEWEALANQVGLDEKPTLSFLATQVSSSFISQEMTFQEILPGLKEAMQGLLSMKRKEGAALEKEFLSYVNEIRLKLDLVAPLVTQAVEKYRHKLIQRIAELELKGDADRLMLEVTLFADRIDIAEEVARLSSHLDQFQGGFSKKAAGRELAFLLQEMLREVSTLLAKSQESELTKTALEIKSVVEKMKEQIANIE